jgi:magnesium chelatase subunit D
MVDSRRTQKTSGDVPFSGIVGQEDMKEALLAAVTDEALDGLLVRGEKGTAKSTAVRALADLLPDQRAVADCPYGCSPDGGVQCADCRERGDPPVETRPVPLVTLPLGATRERVVGTLSVADALDGDHEFDPGLLARANRGILYVDEVNLLDDHLVDVVLDAAAGGLNRVERDSVSVSHPAEFTLVGTMNPEEGDLRPQLRDRFALQATVTGCTDLADRVAVVDRALGRDRTETDDASVRRRLVAARDRLDDVDLPREHVEEIAQLCLEAGVDGHRGDIATARTARALAALAGRERVEEGDLRRAAELALPHRLQSRPFENAPDPGDVVSDHFEEGDDADDASGGTDGETPGEDHGATGGDDTTPAEDAGGTDGDPDGNGCEPGDQHRKEGSGESDGSESPTPAGRTEPGVDDPAGSRQPADGEGEAGGESGDADRQEGTPLVPGQSRSAVADAGEATAPEFPGPDADGGTDRAGSRAGADPGVDRRGPRVRTTRADDNTTVEAAASVRAAASRGSASVESRDLRASVRAGEAAPLVVFVVDASASMRPAMRAAKGTVLELLEDSYQQRDEVAFVAFAGEDAEVLLPPTDSVTLAARHLKDLPTGDRTPLPAGLDAAADVLDRADPAAGVVVLVTDGRANAADDPVADTRTAARHLARSDPRVLVVDAGADDRAALTDLVVRETDGTRVPLDGLSADRVDAAAGAARETRF